MKHATSIALHQYWRSCNGGTGVPAGEIRAIELAPLLPSLFLVDLDIAAGLRFRFCGAGLAMRYGRDLADESFLALWNAIDWQALERDVRVIAMRSTGLVAGVTAETVGSGVTSFEMLLLPLAGETGMAGAIGSMARVGDHEELNRIRARVVSQSLRSVRFLPPVERRPRFDATAPAALVATLSATRRPYRHLTVVIGGK